MNIFENEALNQKSGSVKVLGYVSTFFDHCGGLRNMNLGMPPSHCFHLSKQCFLRSLMHSKGQYLIFESKSRFLKSCLKSFYAIKFDFWSLSECRRVIRDTFPTSYDFLETFGEKIFFGFFWNFLHWFWPIFGFKVSKIVNKNLKNEKISKMRP